jgi:hypothetical protein
MPGMVNGFTGLQKITEKKSAARKMMKEKFF